jgi:hypothetical protein
VLFTGSGAVMSAVLCAISVSLRYCLYIRDSYSPQGWGCDVSGAVVSCAVCVQCVISMSFLSIRPPISCVTQQFTGRGFNNNAIDVLFLCLDQRIT